MFQSNSIPGDGTVKSAMTDKSDIGRWVARIIADPRTLNKSVFAYNEVWTLNDIYDLMEKLSGEKLERSYVSRTQTHRTLLLGKPRSSDMITQSRKTSEETTKKAIDDALASTSPHAHYAIATHQYSWSWGIRGDNTPEHAEYLGYLDARELYPDFQPRTYESFVKDLLDGKGSKVYTRGATTASDYKKATQ